MRISDWSSDVCSSDLAVYMNYLMKALPSIARAVSSSPDAYVYLAESIRAWPDQQGLARLIHQAGWKDCEVLNLTGGIVALHRATACRFRPRFTLAPQES